MLHQNCALQTCNTSHTQSATSKCFASKTQVNPIFCPWLIKYSGKSGFSLLGSVVETQAFISKESKSDHSCLLSYNCFNTEGFITLLNDSTDPWKAIVKLSWCSPWESSRRALQCSPVPMEKVPIKAWKLPCIWAMDTLSHLQDSSSSPQWLHKNRLCMWLVLVCNIHNYVIMNVTNQNQSLVRMS